MKLEVIHYGGRSVNTKVFLDNAPVEGLLRGISCSINADTIPVVCLEFDIIEDIRLALTDPEITIPGHTAKFLVALGWAPPGSSHKAKNHRARVSPESRESPSD